MKFTIVALMTVAAACGSNGPTFVDVSVVPGPATTISVGETSTIAIHATSPGGLLDVVIDCHPSDDAADVDTVGFHFDVDAPALGASPARAGYLRVRTVVPAGPFDITLDASSGPATCDISLTPAPNACGALTVFRSVNTDHTHFAPEPAPSNPPGWEAFPVSGNHYPIWAPWSTSFPAAIRTGYLVHDLEHGGIVLSYKCADAQESAACTQVQTQFVAARAAFATTSRRSLDTPDPSQPALVAARAWRWGLSADCYDDVEITSFMNARFRHGREDLDTDYPTPFDPTQ